MGSILSGKNMAVNATSGTGIFAFRIAIKHYPPVQFGGNQTGAAFRGLGNTDWNGWFRGNGHTPVVFPNDSFSFSCAPKQTGTVGVTGTARCLAIEIVVDGRNPKKPVPIYHTVHFGANSVLVPGQTAPTDSSTAAIYPPKGLCAFFHASQARTKYQRLMIFARGIAEAVDCTTDGQFYRSEGEIDAEFEWIINTDDSSDFPLISNGQKVTRMYVTGSTFWGLNWMVLEDAPDPWEIDRMQPNKPVDARFRATFSGHDGTTSGEIVDPSTTEIWPTDGR